MDERGPGQIAGASLRGSWASGFGGPAIREVLDNPPNVLLGTTIVLVLRAGPRPASSPIDAAQQRAYVMAGLKLIAIGVGILVLGTVATYVVSSLFRGSGTVILATGAFAVGMISIVRGLYYVSIRGFIR